jgi:hypothetical protein
MAKENSIIPWQSLAPAVIPASVSDPVSIITTYAIALRDADKRSLTQAFAHEEYAMGAAHLWRRAMSKLRARLAKLGVRFLAEMLNREDIGEFASPDEVLTDADTIGLAEALGYVDATGAHRLRQSFETLAHFDREDVGDEMALNEAAGVVRACVQYVVGSGDSDAALDFSKFRSRLTAEALKADDAAVTQLLGSPPFFLRTALRVLIAAVKMEKSAKLEYALANLNLLLPELWERITDRDRYSVGNTFLEITGAGNRPVAVAGLRKALLRVKGFDYVPENLRSNSFRQAAQAVMKAHNSFDNYAGEEQPTKNLAAMGNIPQPALAECLRAYLSVYLGNHWGHSWAAAPIAHEELRRVTPDRWQYYLSRVLAGESDVVSKLVEERPVKRWIDLAKELKFQDVSISNGPVKQLVDAAVKNNVPGVTRGAWSVIQSFRGVAPASQKA